MVVSPTIERLLSSGRASAHLATSHDDRPHVAPVWYVYDNSKLYLMTGGRKLRNIAENPRVAISIENTRESYWAVSILGMARIVTDREKVTEIRRKLNAKYRTTATDGGESGYEYRLVEIEIGSATRAGG
ncbi:pyridoxamine 5'-phosphate oxidase family protein [Haladaptatus sp. DJG-WS-42]|uniref:pyridoxamine 5'-phosphate oxidase family protein n=1 Tax=Haladaptatus sp. DJG-WS-42 TaxID=3120516 RepID=UPI0030D3ED3D